MCFATVFSACAELPDSPLEPGSDSALDVLPPGFTGVEMVPGGPLNLLPGDTATLRVDPKLTRTVRFESSDTTVVSISTSGLLTALKPGNAFIRVRINSISSQGGLTVNVGSRGSASIRFLGLLTADSVPLAGESVNGTVSAEFEFSRGNARRLEVWLDDLQLCGRSLSLTAPMVALPATESATCTFDTAAYDSVAATPVLRNGPVALVGRLVGSESVVLASTDPRRYDIANRDTVIFTVVPERQAVSKEGTRWVGGSISVEARPLLFSRSAPIDEVHFVYRRPGGGVFEVNDSEAPFQASFDAASLKGALDRTFIVQARALSRGGVVSTGNSEPIPYDGVAPVPGTLEARPWVGASTSFASLYRPTPGSDVGVGEVSPRFFGGPSSLSPAQIVASGRRVSMGSDFAPSLPGTNRVVLQACDALRNCAEGRSFDFGVDLNAPTIVSISHPRRTINPSGIFKVETSDDLSGVPSPPLEIAAIGIKAGFGPVCGPVLGGFAYPGEKTDNGCAFQPTESTLPLPLSDEGYLFLQVVGRDLAGNRTQRIDRDFLIDRLPPVLQSWAVPTQFAAGEEFATRLELSDNVDLWKADLRFHFATASGVVVLPAIPSVTVGTPFSGTPVTRATVDTRVPFVRSLTTIEPQRSTVLVRSIESRITDAAGYVSDISREIPQSAFGGNTSVADPFATIRSVRLTSSSTACASNCPASAPALSATLRVTGDAGIPPFNRVLLIAKQGSGTSATTVTSALIASTNTPSVVDTGTQRTYTYLFNASLDPAMLGDATLFAVAISGAGNALRSAEIPIIFTAN